MRSKKKLCYGEFDKKRMRRIFKETIIARKNVVG